MRRFFQSLLLVMFFLPCVNGADLPVLSAWVAEWDLPNGWGERGHLVERTEALQIFAAVFDNEDRPYLQPDLEAWVAANLPVGAGGPLLTVVNDAIRPDGNVLKDPEVVSRVLATPESRARHREHLLDLLRSGRFSGLDMDYERVKTGDWPVYLDFCRELSDELARSGMRLRVVMEPKRQYFTTRLPDGPEYVVMGYNLFGGHSGPGPKADAEFIARLAAWCRAAGQPVRLALSTGGFAWSGEGGAESLTESRAASLAATHQAGAQRDAASRYVHFKYEEDGVVREVWYADAVALSYLVDIARRHGFTAFDIWRLGGNDPQTLAAVKSALAFRGAGRTIRVPEDAPGINAAVAMAEAGDHIVVAPGEYRESVGIDKAGLSISAPPGEEFSRPVRIVGDASGPAVRDSADTRWRGVVFAAGAAGQAAALDGFTGSFEYCRFESGFLPGEPAILVFGGLPLFHGCEFAGAGGATAMGMTGVIASPGQPSALADFTYCRFEGFGSDMINFSGDIGARFANCLFTGNGRLFGRAGNHLGAVEIVNGVIFFNRTNDIAPDNDALQPVLIDHSIYTPTFDHRLWTTGPTPDLLPGLAVRDSRCLSPRFRDVGHGVMVNIGIDDTRNIGVFEEVSRAAEEFGFKATLAVNTGVATPDDWTRLNRLFERGHEIGSHTSSHILVQKSTPLLLGYPASGGEPAMLSIDGEHLMEVRAGDDVVFSQALDAPGLGLRELTRNLIRAGFVVDLSPYLAGAPARFLAPTGEPVDIGYAKAVVPLEIDMDEFVTFEVGGSRQVLLDNISGMAEATFINPFAVSSDLAREAIRKYGYVAGRANIETSDTECSNGDPWTICKFSLPSRSLASIQVRPKGRPALENIRLVLDYLKISMPMLSFYSHDWGECDLQDWRGFLAILAEDEKVEVLTLAEMADRVDEIAREVCECAFILEPGPAAADYRPRSDSPMLGAGKPLGLARDFAGSPVPADARPDIGLYQM